ncbi:MAG: hypothetical protein JST50_22610 [Bacteroidetes bacterium]|jgi:hypothetical protein|nr:hypothetical protein [Bacteroidota bacterium]
MRYKIDFKFLAIVLLALTGFITLSSFRASHPATKPKVKGPRIVNIVNFIRLLEPRDSAITEDVLYQTVVKQVALMKKYHLSGTFLLQYDALLDSRYQKLLKSLPGNSFEIGAWWEIPQPLVENAGLKWRGRYPWDWRANIGFSTGYTPHEREQLADVYMRDFKRIFGYYPKSVASWFIDAHTLNYLYQKYHIVASANCKDQYGTDGYTLWGGYWNQAYYPSKVNAYMPAQNEANQIPVPIFRMLGSDPIRQYDEGLGHQRQGVVTLEPVYPRAGGDSTWVNWFFKEFVNGASLGFAYTQAGQENSFTWPAMAKGLELQFQLIKKLNDQKKIKVETLAESGQWFKDHYKVTPPTAVTATEDIPGGNARTVWFDSRFYRANLLWENGTLRFRDIHLFNEQLRSKYETEVATSNECTFFTLPAVDGYLWSTPDKFAGLKFKMILNGKEQLLEGGDPVITESMPGKLLINWPLKNIKGSLEIVFTEKQVRISLRSKHQAKWLLDLETADKAELPFTSVTSDKVSAQFEGMKYAITAAKGNFADPGNTHHFRIVPSQNQILLDL